MLSPTPHYYEVRGRAAEIARTMGSGRVTMEHLFLAMLPDTPLSGGRTAGELGDSYIGLEHAFLEIIRDRAGVPSLALAGLADLDAVDAAVLAAKNAPPRAPDTAAFPPDGQELDADLLTAIAERVPAGASFGFNSLDGRTWIHVRGTDVDPGESRNVLDAALAALGRGGD